MKDRGSLDLKSKFERFVNSQLARVLTQMDRDPDSPTFGCFDRDYWHYKIRDSPSSILQQGIFTLEAMRKGHVASAVPTTVSERWALAAVNALARQIDRAGAVSEYCPFERSYPAAAFSLYAVCRVLYDWRASAPYLLQFVDWPPLRRLAKHVARRIEQQAINQQAAGLAGLAFATQLDLIAARTAGIERHARRLFRSQHREGWFNEYGGPDFGYLTVTLDALADYFDATNDGRALEAMDRAVRFLAQLVGIDGRLPSTLGSRNTDYVVPYGLVRTAARNSLASWLVARLFDTIDHPSHPIWATDDRYLAHFIFASVVRSLPHLQDMKPDRAPALPMTQWMDGCGIWIYWPPDRRWTAYVGARKGGLIRIHRRGNLPPIVDHGWRVYGDDKVWTSNWWSGHWRVEKNGNTVHCRGRCQRVDFHTASPAKHAVLRLLAWVLRERLSPILKRVMILRPGRADGPPFYRVVEITDDGVQVRDHLGPLEGAKAGPGPRQNLRHVASAGTFSVEEWLPSLLGEGGHPLDRELSVEISWDAASETVMRWHS